MYLKKEIVDGKATYVKIDKSEAKELRKKGIEVLLVDDDFADDAINEAEDQTKR